MVSVITPWAIHDKDTKAIAYKGLRARMNIGDIDGVFDGGNSRPETNRHSSQLRPCFSTKKWLARKVVIHVLFGGDGDAFALCWDEMRHL